MGIKGQFGFFSVFLEVVFKTLTASDFSLKPLLSLHFIVPRSMLWGARIARKSQWRIVFYCLKRMTVNW